MKILNYEFHQEKGLSYGQVDFSNINLIVGISGAGKSRFINTIFNFGLFAFQENKNLRDGNWNMTFSENDNIYNWQVSIQEKKVIKENISLISDNTKKVIISRDKKKLTYKTEPPMNLNSEKLSTILIDEPEIVEIRNGFGKLYQRRFSEQSLLSAFEYGAMNNSQIKGEFEKEASKLFNYAINIRLYILKNHFPLLYKKIVEDFREVFPFVTRMDFKLESRIIPMPKIYEKGIADPIDLNQLSSGMKKVILFMTDIATMKNSSLYLIDEYENSLGINAIDFLPDLLFDTSDKIQYIITSHHPYLINNISIKNWLVFNRKGRSVKIIFGDEALERYGKSKQDAFVKLINDPFFSHENL